MNNAEYQKRYFEKHPEANAQGVPHAVANRKKYEKYNLTSKGRAATMLNNARKRARDRGVLCTLTQDWIQQKLDAGVCEVTGLPFQMSINGGRGHNNNSFSPSLDRINQKGDYTPDNVRMAVWIYNRARGAFPDNDFDILLEALLTRAA